MFHLIKNSLAFRSALFFKVFCGITFLRKKASKEMSDLTLITLTGKKHTGLLTECLLSIYRSSSLLPKLAIISDGSISSEELEKKLNWWPGNINIYMPDEIFDYHKHRDELLVFAKKNPMGLKMALILRFAELGPTFYTDTDVIWYKDIHSLVPADQSIKIQMSPDYQPAYDENLISDKPYSDIKYSPWFCAGIMYAHGNLYNTLPEIKKLTLKAMIKSNHFSEQTIFAAANYFNGKSSWPIKEVTCFQSDQLTLKPSYIGQHWICRHYVGPVRHIFWRDAFFLRLGIKA
jgi:hypothetical protein